MTDWEALAFGRRYQPPGSEWCSNLSAKNTIDPRNNSILSYSLLRDVRQLSPTSTRCTPIFIDLSSSSFSLAHPSVVFSRTILTSHCAQLPEDIEDIFHMERNEVNLVLGSLRPLVKIPGIECRRSQHEEPEGEDCDFVTPRRRIPRRRRSFRSFLYQP